MKLYEKEIFIPLLKNRRSLIKHFSEHIKSIVPSTEIPIRFVVTKTNGRGHYCELGILSKEEYQIKETKSIFEFRKRSYENIEKFNAVLLIPTGIGAEIGGHCGDASATARLIASACDTLITHPNVVNASEINELPENGIYTEGSIISRLLMGQIGLQKVRSNRILMLMDKHEEGLFNDEIINSISSARVTLGVSCDVYEMDKIICSESKYSSSGRCVGEVRNLENIFNVIKKNKEDYDAIALSTFITVPENFHKDYFGTDDMINPWGGIEAMLTHSIAEIFKIPCAHSPMMASKEIMNLEVGIVDPRKAPETSSTTYLHCILKGLHKSPKITSYEKGLNVEDVSCIIIPDKCLGLPILAALEQNIPVIAVRDNKNIMENNLESLLWSPGQLIKVDSYLEAAGAIHALKSGISLESVKRPIGYTKVISN